MVPGDPLRVPPRALSPDPGRSGRISLARRSCPSTSRSRKWSVIVALAAALLWSAAGPAAARQGNPPPEEQRSSADRHAARRAALERQRRGDPGAADARHGAWPWTGYGAAPWGRPYAAPWGRPYAASWGLPYAAPWVSPYTAPRGGPYTAPWSGPYGAGWSWSYGAYTGWSGAAAAPFWSYRSPRRRPGGWSRFGAHPGQRPETPYDWPWGWSYVPRHRFEGLYRDEPAGGSTPGGRRWPLTPIPAPWWFAPPAWYRWGADPSADPSADCAYVVVQVLYGGTFSGWVEPGRFGAEDLRELELAIDALLSEGHSLVLLRPDGYPVRVPAGLPIDDVRVAPCSAAARP